MLSEEAPLEHLELGMVWTGTVTCADRIGTVDCVDWTAKICLQNHDFQH